MNSSGQTMTEPQSGVKVSSSSGNGWSTTPRDTRAGHYLHTPLSQSRRREHNGLLRKAGGSESALGIDVGSFLLTEFV